MKHARRRAPRQRLTSAIALTLAVGAVTSQATAVASPVTDAAVPDLPAQSDEAVASIASGSEVLSAGTGGLLTRSPNADVVWTAFGAGAGTRLGSSSVDSTNRQKHGAASDTVVITRSATSVDVYDMAQGTGPVRIDLKYVPGNAQYIGAAGTHIVARSIEPWGAETAHLLTSDLSRRQVTGLPEDAQNITTAAATGDAVLLRYSTASGTAWHMAVVDLGTAAVTDTYASAPNISATAAALSQTHVAWFDRTQTWGTMILNVAERGGTVRKVTVHDMDWPVVGLTGGWVTYSNSTRIGHGSPNSLMALTALPVAGGPSVRLLDRVTTIAPAPDGSLLAMGGTVAKGEGAYRVAALPNAAPMAELVASTGLPTALTLLGHSVPAVIDLDPNRGQVPLAWRLSRLNTQVALTIRHTRTGRTWPHYETPYNDTKPLAQDLRMVWDSDSAPNGDYTWNLLVTPTDGIGPDLNVSGSFKAERTVGPHDYTDNGTPDLLARDSSGRLWREDTQFSLLNNHIGRMPRKLVGAGWQIYNRIEAAGNIAGGTAGDLVARDTAGVLWLYQGRGDGTFTTRVKIGGGWQGYQHLAASSDLTGDGRPDLVATDTAGALWLHPGTGKATAPFAARKKVGLSGWQTFNQLTATGNIAGGAAGDLVARDTAGVLWLYQGRGDGTFTTRVKIGGGWNAYTHIVGAGDANHDGRPDLYVWAPYMETYIYQGTGNASAPFTGRKPASVLTESWQSYNHIV